MDTEISLSDIYVLQEPLMVYFGNSTEFLLFGAEKIYCKQTMCTAVFFNVYGHSYDLYQTLQVNYNNILREN